MADLHELNPKEILKNDFKSKPPSTFESLSSGAVGGMCLVLVGHPLDLLKVRLQTTTTTTTTSADAVKTRFKPSMSKMLSILIRKEGISGIYRGVTAPLIGVAPIFAINIWGFDTGKSIAASYLNREHNDALVVALGGAFTAIPTSIVQVPGDRIKLRLQVSDAMKHANPFQEARKIWSEGGGTISGGMRSLYRGYLITLAREIPGSAIYFSNYNYMRKLITARLEEQQRFSPDSIAAASILISGGFAGTLIGLLTLPIDTIKSRFQAAPLGEFSSARNVAMDLLKKEGPAALFKGLGPVLLRAFPANAACFGGIEAIRYLCK